MICTERLKFNPERGCCIGKLKTASSRELSSDSAVSVHQMILVVYVCLSRTATSLPSLVVEAQNDRRLSSAQPDHVNNAERCPIFGVGYLHFVKRQHLHSSTVFNRVRSFNTGKQQCDNSALALKHCVQPCKELQHWQAAM